MLFNPLGRQRRITQPTLVVQSTADQVVDPGNAGALADLLPDARVKLLDGAGICSTGSSPDGGGRDRYRHWRPAPLTRPGVPEPLAGGPRDRDS